MVPRISEIGLDSSFAKEAASDIESSFMGFPDRLDPALFARIGVGPTEANAIRAASNLSPLAFS